MAVNCDATELPRLMQCLASHSMPGFLPPGMDATEYQLEGNAAHWLAKGALSGAISDISEYIDRKAPNGHYIDDIMAEHVNNYVNKVRSRSGVKHIEHPMVLQLCDGVTINCRPDVFTGDAYGDVWIEDFKYGWALVEAERNFTMLAYAIAHSRHYRTSADTVYWLVIHQPRPYHPEGPVRLWRLDILALRQWERYMIDVLSNPNPMLQTGPSCYKCPARTNCPPYLQSVYSIFDFTAQPLPHELPPKTLSELRDQVKIAVAKLENYADALDERIVDTLKRGNPVPNYCLMPNEKPLEWHDFVTKETLHALTTAPISKEKLLTPTQLKRTLGDAIIAALAHRPNGGLKLQRMDVSTQVKRLLSERK